MGASPAWAADAACTAPNLPMRPIMATHTIPPYPEVSVMTNESGTTLLEVHIGADGVPDAASVVNSSGSLRLDAAAADHVKSTWRWNAPVQNCQPMAVRTRVSIKWDLRDRPDTGLQPPTVNMDVKDYPPGARQRREEGAVGLMVVVSPDGAVTPVVTASSGFSELDEKSVELAKTWRFAPASLDGRPVLTPVMLISVWSLDPKR
jgi:TonB family protein